MTLGNYALEQNTTHHGWHAGSVVLPPNPPICAAVTEHNNLCAKNVFQHTSKTQVLLSFKSKFVFNRLKHFLTQFLLNFTECYPISLNFTRWLTQF